MPHTYGVSTRQDGQMRILDHVLTPVVLENRRRFFISKGIDPDTVISADLIHGSTVAIIGTAKGAKIIPQTDALVSNKQGLTLAVTIADCLPIFLYDPIQHAVGIAHAGWRGVLSGVAIKTIEAMQIAYGSQVSDLQMIIGPHLRNCHFEVQADVANKFKGYEDCITRQESRITIDLSACVIKQVTAVGIPLPSITVSPECTYELPSTYFSYRRDKPVVTEAMIAYIQVSKD